MLKSLSSSGCWVMDVPSRVFGLELGARMTVVRLSDGALWICSPLEPTPELQRELAALGPVRFVIAPNTFHHTYIAAWSAAYPDAQIFAAPGVAKAHSDVSFAGILNAQPEAAWANDIDQIRFDGNSTVNEIVFFHRASRTLILTDLCFYLRSNLPWPTRLFARLSGILNRLSVDLFVRITTKDKRAARTSVDRILQWPFERIIVAHGDIIEKNAPSALRRAFAWLK